MDHESRDRLGRFSPGHSGNPGGRPRGRSLTAALNAALDESDDEGRTRRERIVARLLEAAERGDLRAIGLVLDRTEGRPAIAAAEADDEPIVFPTLDPKAR